jgi:hypothetical protein
MTGPKFGGVPDRLRHGDWLLVEWVAAAKPGDPFATTARETSAAAKRWLETHPEPEQRPEPPHRGMRWGADRLPWDR